MYKEALEFVDCENLSQNNEISIYNALIQKLQNPQLEIPTQITPTTSVQEELDATAQSGIDSSRQQERSELPATQSLLEREIEALPITLVTVDENLTSAYATDIQRPATPAPDIDLVADIVVTQELPNLKTFCHMIQSGSINLCTLYNPQLIDLYFSYSKALSQNNIEDAVFCRGYSWQYKGHLYSSHSDNVYNISSFYVAISHEITLETKIYGKCKSALSKMRIARERGQDGIKFIHSGILELKINSET